MTYTFESSFSEQYLASVATALQTKSGLVGWIGMALVGIFMLAITIALPLAGREPVSATSVAVVVWCLGMNPGLTAYTVWTIRYNNRTVVGRHTITVDVDGVAFSHATFDTKLRWTAVRKVRETKNFFLFFCTASAAQYLPKRAVAPDDLPTLRTLIQQGMSSVRD